MSRCKGHFPSDAFPVGWAPPTIFLRPGMVGGAHPTGNSSIMDEDIPAPVPGQPEGEFARSPEGLADRAMPPGGGHQQEEAAAAGPEELAAEGAVASGRLVPFLDLPEADPEAE